MASTKRDLPEEGEPEQEKQPDSKKTKVDGDGETKRHRVVLNPADCNLDFNIGDDGLEGSGLYEQGFAYCWSGARANVGITGGKYCFGCKILSAQPVEIEDTPADQQHVCRLGISRGDDAVGDLGESDRSFGFGGTGKFSTFKTFSDYGEKFGVGDTIVCAVDLESKPLASLRFSKNGKCFGTAIQINAGPRGLRVVDSPRGNLQWESAIFPHILLKNVVVQLQFSVEEGLILEEGFKPWAASLDDGNAIMGPSFPSVRDCEVMMMVGLPASGKSTWADKWVKEHPEKRYILLGTNLLLGQMKIPGLLRQRNYGERFDRLISRASQMLDALLPRAATTPRNYIIDQTNVYKSARKRKLRPFVNFRKVATVLFPEPEELKLRAAKRFKEMGKEVPADAINNMIANYALPSTDELFNEIKFVELERGEAQRRLDEMKLALGPSPIPYSQGGSIQSYNQVNPAYPGSVPYQGDQNYPVPNPATTYGPGIQLRPYSGQNNTVSGSIAMPSPIGSSVASPYSCYSPYESSLASPYSYTPPSPYAGYPHIGPVSHVMRPPPNLQVPAPHTVIPSTLPSAYGYPHQAVAPIRLRPPPPPMYKSGGYNPSYPR